MTDYFMFEDRDQPLTPYQEEKRQKSIELAEALANFANGMARDPEDFLKVLSMQHRTLQQSVTRLFMQWLEYIANPSYKTDPRNDAAQKLAQKLIAAMQKEYDLPSMENILSGMLPTI